MDIWGESSAKDVSIIYFLYESRDWGTPAQMARDLTALLHWESAKMANKKGTDIPENGKQWTRFIDIPLGGYSGADLGDRYPDWDTFDADLVALLSGGYRVAVSYNEANHSFIASVTCRATGDPNNGCTFTSFAGDWTKALQVACFKHFVVAKGVWSSASTTPIEGQIG